MAILKPSPSSPRRFDAGTTTSTRAKAEVSVERCPILSRCFSIVTPGVSIGTTNAEMPRCPLSGSVFANTTVQVAWPAFVMKVFDPLRTYSSPRRTAVVFIRATSDPASGSDRPNEQRIGSSMRRGSHSAFCSSVPAISTGPAPRPLAMMAVPIPEQPQQSSSPTSMLSNADRARPPSSSGTWRFMSPTSWAFAITSAGCVECSSYSAAFGRISRSANSRASARSSRCSSLRANETPPATPCSTVATADPPRSIDWSVNQDGRRRVAGASRRHRPPAASTEQRPEYADADGVAACMARPDAVSIAP